MIIVFIALLPIILNSTINVIIWFCCMVIIGVFYKILLPKVKGKIGEYITQNVIESYCNKRGYPYLYDVMVPNEETGTSQIDHLIITRRGIAVIETKFYSGTLYGSEYDKDWTYTNRDENNKKYKYKGHNPVSQNYGHIQSLKGILKNDVEYYNIVLFIDSVNFGKCKVSNKYTRVGYTYNLNEIIEELDSISERKILNAEGYEIYCNIRQANITDKTVRKEHVHRIRENLKNRHIA